MPVTGNTEHTRPENRAFFPALDGLRAVAFLMVFFQHFYYVPWGWTGVNIFFVLSGFLITGILFDTRNHPNRARNFYLRRTLRIFPLYYGIFLAILLLYPVFHWRWSGAWFAWPLYVANFLRFLSPSAAIVNSPLELAADAHLSSRLLPHTQLYLGHFWSLCVEEQFYLFWPWVVFWIGSRRKLIWICSTAIIVVPLLRVLAQNTEPTWMLKGELLYRVTPFQLDSLLLGGLVALLWRSSAANRKLLLRIGRIVARVGAVVTIVYLGLTIHTAALPNWREGYVYGPWRLTWGLTFIDIFSAAVILCCLHPTGWLTRILSIRPLRWLGRISYGAYVFHDILHNFYAHTAVVLGHHSAFCAAHSSQITILFALPGTCLIAWLSFRYFESPFLDLKERWTRPHRSLDTM